MTPATVASSRETVDRVTNDYSFCSKPSLLLQCQITSYSKDNPALASIRAANGDNFHEKLPGSSVHQKVAPRKPLKVSRINKSKASDQAKRPTAGRIQRASEASIRLAPMLRLTQFAVHASSKHKAK
jgi:hypothetical protein